MPFPVSFNKNAPATTDTPGSGDDELRALKDQIELLFGIPDATNLTGAFWALGAHTDGKLARLPITKAALPYLRLIGTEVGGKDVQLVEDAGSVKLQENTGTEAAPVWTTRILFPMAAGTVTVEAAGQLILKAQVFS
jgi:hypothetical protein